MRFRGACLVALALWSVAGRAQAQTTVSKRTLTLEGAKAIAAAAVAEATKGNEGASIAVVDDGGNLMYLERLQPTFPMGATISTEKARTAALFQKPSKILEDAIVGGRTPAAQRLVRAAQRRRADRGGGPGGRRGGRERRLERRAGRGDRHRRRGRGRHPDQREPVKEIAMHTLETGRGGGPGGLAVRHGSRAVRRCGGQLSRPRCGRGRLRQRHADDRGARLQDPREPAGRPGHGRDPHP